MARRIGIGGIWHETNTFAPGRTVLDDFLAYSYADNEEGVLSAHAGTATEIGGALEACLSEGLVARPFFAAAALPWGTVAREARRALWDRFLARLEEALPLDGLLLALHGAMVAEDAEDADSDLVERVRAVAGELPLALVLDLHANPGPDLLERAEVVVAYDTYPHVDAHERGREAVLLLSDILEDKRRPHLAWRKLPLLTCPLGQASEEEPIAALLALVRSWEARPDVACASLLPGYPYADVSRLGFTVAACGWNQDTVEACAETLAEAAWIRRDAFQRELLSPEDAVERALAARAGPIVLVDVTDNVGGGAPGDGTHLLGALLAAGARGAVVVLWDPCCADEAAAAGEGGEARLEVGAPPVALRGRVVGVSHASYRRGGSYMTGQVVDMGLCAVVAVEGNEVVLTSRRVMPFDSDHLRVLGIEPAKRHIVVAKSAIAWQAAFGHFAAEAFFVDGPGICTCRLESLPYERAPRPIVPLDQLRT